MINSFSLHLCKTDLKQKRTCLEVVEVGAAPDADLRRGVALVQPEVRVDGDDADGRLSLKETKTASVYADQFLAIFFTSDYSAYLSLFLVFTCHYSELDGFDLLQQHRKFFL